METLTHGTRDEANQRFDLMLNWLARVLPNKHLEVVLASGDASFRRYFRIHSDGASLIVMDAPPDREDCRPFIQVADLLKKAGLHAPQVLDADIDRGYLLLTDLGRQTYLDVLNEENAESLMSAAIDALIHWQKASRPGVLSPYDATLLRRELDLFPDWYVRRHLKLEPNGNHRALLEDAFARLIDSALIQPQVFVHRDYMPRNLMLSDPNPGVLDFQDAVYGPITYDVVSLFRDAFLSWDEARVAVWLDEYWRKARQAGLPVQSDYTEFVRACDWMGLQRHLKVLGIFARINYRDGKPGYLADTPRFLNYVRIIGGRYAEFAPLVELIETLEHRSAASETLL